MELAQVTDDFLWREKGKKHSVALYRANEIVTSWTLKETRPDGLVALS